MTNQRVMFSKHIMSVYSIAQLLEIVKRLAKEHKELHRKAVGLRAIWEGYYNEHCYIGKVDRMHCGKLKVSPEWVVDYPDNIKEAIKEYHLCFDVMNQIEAALVGTDKQRKKGCFYELLKEKGFDMDRDGDDIPCELVSSAKNHLEELLQEK